MRATGEQHELRAGYERCQESSLVGADSQIVSAVDDERGNPELPVQIPSVTSLVA